ECLVLPANSSGRLIAHGRVALLFSDPLQDDLSSVTLCSSRAMAARTALIRGPKEQGVSFLDRVFCELGVVERTPLRADICRAARAISVAPECFDQLARAADLAGLSPTRFRHVFVEAVGLTFTRFRQWRRMGAVIRGLAEGRSLTEVAHKTGFAGSAHLATAFRAMFGLSPSQLATAQARFILSPLAAEIRMQGEGCEEPVLGR
ncbi:MAG: helix-turn-helix domain-containing protein, partial [Myxococcota bacterium]